MQCPVTAGPMGLVSALSLVSVEETSPATPPKPQRFPWLGPLSRAEKKITLPGLPPASPGSVALPHWMPRGARLHQSVDIMKVV
jgi:hypothetical protein